jgi:hypothetical protein
MLMMLMLPRWKYRPTLDFALDSERYEASLRILSCISDA